MSIVLKSIYSKKTVERISFLSKIVVLFVLIWIESMYNNFERNEIRASVFLKWMYFKYGFCKKIHIYLWMNYWSDEHLFLSSKSDPHVITTLESRECVSTGAAGAQTRRSLVHHHLHPLILRLQVLNAPAVSRSRALQDAPASADPNS